MIIFELMDRYSELTLLIIIWLNIKVYGGRMYEDL